MKSSSLYLVLFATVSAIATATVVHHRTASRESSVKGASIVLLVHGLREDAGAWDRRGFLDILTGNGGMCYEGNFLASVDEGSVAMTPAEGSDSVDSEIPLYTVSITDQAQRNIRKSGVELGLTVSSLLERHPDANITLVGYSLGGVIAREYLTSDKSGTSAAVSRLITISSPHLGSELALFPHLWREWSQLPAADSSSPHQVSPPTRFGPFQAKLVESITDQLPFRLDSEAAAMLLPPDLGGAYLAELNTRPHPGGVEYICIISEKNFMTVTLREMIAAADGDSDLSSRIGWALVDWLRSGVRLSHDPTATDDSMNGDGAVSLYSQDLNHVPAFSEAGLKAEVFRVDGAHNDRTLAGDLTRLILRQ